MVIHIMYVEPFHISILMLTFQTHSRNLPSDGRSDSSLCGEICHRRQRNSGNSRVRWHNNSKDGPLTGIIHISTSHFKQQKTPIIGLLEGKTSMALYGSRFVRSPLGAIDFIARSGNSKHGRCSRLLRYPIGHVTYFIEKIF
jgi:hypothetical protein